MQSSAEIQLNKSQPPSQSLEMFVFNILFILLMQGSLFLNRRQIIYERIILTILWMAYSTLLPQHIVKEPNALLSLFWLDDCFKPHAKEILLLAALLHFEGTALVEVAQPAILPTCFTDLIAAVYDHLLVPFAAVWLGFAMPDVLDKTIASTIMEICDEGGWAHGMARARWGRTRKDPSRVFAFQDKKKKKDSSSDSNSLKN